MKQSWGISSKHHITVFVAFLCGLFICNPVPLNAEGKGLFTTRRLMGVVFLGGSAALAKKGFDYHKDADELYELYEGASEPEEAVRFYDRTTNRDVKSQVSWALAAAFALSGARLVLTRNIDLYEPQVAPRKITVRGLELEPQVDHRRVGMQLKKIWDFF